jgi:hypothetical protein
VRLTKFVHGLILALCSVSTVLAAKDSQTDIGAAVNQQVTSEIVTQVVAGASSSYSFANQVTGSSQRILLAAADKNGQQRSTQSVSADAAQKQYDNFQELDVEAEKVLREVLDLSSDLAIIDEQHVNPPKNQLLVLVTLQPSKFFELDFVELQIDNQVVAAHPYTEKDIAAMVRGGGHRLYLANLPAGTHELKAKFVGKVPRDPDYRREAIFKFISGVNRTLIELYINSGENNSFPQFTVREWN